MQNKILVQMYNISENQQLDYINFIKQSHNYVKQIINVRYYFLSDNNVYKYKNSNNFYYYNYFPKKNSKIIPSTFNLLF